MHFDFRIHGLALSPQTCRRLIISKYRDMLSGN